MNGELKAGLVLASLITLMLVVSFFWTPYDCNEMNVRAIFSPPGASHLLGTDNFGRDIFSRIMTGCRHTLLLAFCTVAGAAAIGTIIGLFSGFTGGIIDECVMRLIDALQSFPGIVLALAAAAVLGSGQSSLLTALLILFTPSFTRVMRSGALQYKCTDFILAEKLLGAGGPRILFIHILPNLTPTLLSASALGLSNAILAEAAMSYLGLGIQPPAPSWGRMLSESQNVLFTAPWCALAPGLFIVLAVTAFHFLGEGLRRRGDV